MVVTKTYPILVIPGYALLLCYTSAIFCHIFYLGKLSKFELNWSELIERKVSKHPLFSVVTAIYVSIYILKFNFSAAYLDKIIYLIYNVCIIIIILFYLIKIHTV